MSDPSLLVWYSRPSRTQLLTMDDLARALIDWLPDANDVTAALPELHRHVEALLAELVRPGQPILAVARTAAAAGIRSMTNTPLEVQLLTTRLDVPLRLRRLLQAHASLQRRQIAEHFFVAGVLSRPQYLEEQIARQVTAFLNTL